VGLLASLCTCTVLLAACSSTDSQPASPLEEVRDSIVFIETDAGGGSGVIFDNELHVVTNYHVIRNAFDISVVLPDGSRDDDVEIIGFDRASDVAVVKLSDAGVGFPPIKPGREGEIEVGDTTFAIGYPLEGGSEEPIIQVTQGIVSAHRPGAIADVQYVQTDATFSPGLSGGALVDRSGEFIGMPTLVLSPLGPVGLAIAAADVLEIAKGLLLSGTKSDGVAAGGSRSDRSDLALFKQEIAYRLTSAAGTRISVTLESQADLVLAIFGPNGQREAVAAGPTDGIQTARIDQPPNGNYTVVVFGFGASGPFRVEATQILRAYEDPEDGHELAVGDDYLGELQFEGDSDTLYLNVDSDDEISILVQSWTFDPNLTVFFPGPDATVLEDDDSGLGPTGADAKITLRPTGSGTYRLLVGAGFSGFPGFYKVHVFLAE
jgi:S1-C subfamily serine protease